jgi:cbb3-type cytochrome oxidase maturation protein
MIVVYFLIPLSIIVAVCFLALFIWAVRSGQYEDTDTPSMRLLLEEQKLSNPDDPINKRDEQKSEAKSMQTKDD